jgi:DNA-binding HxlR family transcriptional regulator
MTSREKKISRVSAPERSARMVEAIYGCKWSLTVYRLLADGINRPGEMVRSVDGLTTKVLNDCLRKNLDFGIINRVAYPEIPPRVEYEITAFGTKFIRILDQIESLQGEIEAKCWMFYDQSGSALTCGAPGPLSSSQAGNCEKRTCDSPLCL